MPLDTEPAPADPIDPLEGFVRVEVLGLPDIAIGQSIGSGASGDVWSGVEVREPKRQVAMKFVSCPSNSPHLRLRIHRWESEARNWSRFQQNPHVVQLYRVLRQITNTGGDDIVWFGFVMEFSPFGDLQKWLSKKERLFAGPCPRGRSHKLRIAHFLLALAQALHTGHILGIIHGDIKSNNVLLFAGGLEVVPKLMDFGISWNAAEGSSEVAGTPEYMAPELFARAAGDTPPFPHSDDETRMRKAADVYSLGILFWEVLTGALPFRPSSGLSEHERRAACRAFHENLAWEHNLPTVRHGPATVDLGGPWSLIARLGMGELLEKMLHKSWESRLDIDAVIQRLRVMEDDEVVLFTAAPPPHVVTPNRYRWHPRVHRAFKQRLCYYFIRGWRPLGDPIWIENNLKNEGVTGFSMYRLLGGYDLLLRCWLTDLEEEKVNTVLGQFRTYHQGAFARFLVDERGIIRFANVDVQEADYDLTIDSVAQTVFSLRPAGDDASLHASASASAEAEFLALKNAGLVNSIVHGAEKYLQTKWPMRVFMTISATGHPSDFWMKSYVDELARRFAGIVDGPADAEETSERPPGARPHRGRRAALHSLSIYRGTGEYRFLVKFRIGRIENLAKVYRTFFTVASLVQNDQTVLSSQSYIEICGLEALMSNARLPESDDGTLVRNLSQRAAREVRESSGGRS